MTKRLLILLIIMALLFITLAFCAAGSCVSWLSARAAIHQANNFKYNGKVLDFTKMYVDLVLKTDGKISFDDRLRLENAVRATNDESIIDQWKKFTEATSGQEAGKEAKTLLQLLLNKINQ